MNCPYFNNKLKILQMSFQVKNCIIQNKNKFKVQNKKDDFSIVLFMQFKTILSFYIIFVIKVLFSVKL